MAIFRLTTNSEVPNLLFCQRNLKARLSQVRSCGLGQREICSSTTNLSSSGTIKVCNQINGQLVVLLYSDLFKWGESLFKGWLPLIPFVQHFTLSNVTFTLSLAGSSTPSRQCAAVTMTAGLQESKTAPHPRQRLSDLRCTICSCSQLKILQKNFDVWHFVSLFDKEQRAFECEGLHFFCKWSYTVQELRMLRSLSVCRSLTLSHNSSFALFQDYSTADLKFATTVATGGRVNYFSAV